MKIIADENIPYCKEYFSGYGELALIPGREITNAHLQEADLLLVRSITHVDQQLLKNTPVKFVGSVTAGIDHLDTTWLESAGILWASAAGFNAPPVADYVVSVIANLKRKRVLRKDALKAAIIGVGHVGQQVADRLRILGFTVTLCDPVRATKEPDFNSVALTDIHDMDLISIHVPLTRSGAYPTHHFIDAEFLKKQKAGCVMVNASRGAVIDTKVIQSAGDHLEWCLDVFEHEPRIDKFLLETVFIATPHIAGYSVQSKMRGIQMIYNAACTLGILSPQARQTLTLPEQTLKFAAGNHHWEDIVLGVFNPSLMTAMLRNKLIPSANWGKLFDEIRHEFNYRHEFAYTHLEGLSLLPEDVKLLYQLGFRFK